MERSLHSTHDDVYTHAVYAPFEGLIRIAAFAVLFGASSILSKFLTPIKVKSTWKFKNILMSLFHAVIAGVWAMYCLLNNSAMASDVIHTFDTSSYNLVCFSTGYFVHDSIDMLKNFRKRESFELLGHHIVIFFCFGVSVITQEYIGYAVVALIAEINSIFLHSRQLMMICRVNKSSSFYRLNSLMNMGSYITFRIMTFAWMTRWLLLNKDDVPLGLFTLGSVGLAVITAMNIILFYRLLKSDFFHSSSKLDRQKAISN